MVHALQTVGVGEMGVRAPQLRGPLVHPLHEGVDGPGHPLRQDVGGLVGGDHDDAVEQLLHRQLLPHLDAGVAAVGGQVGDGRLRGGEDRIQGQLSPVHRLQHQQGGHDLGGAGGVEALMDVPGVEHLPGVRVRQQGGFGLHLPVADVSLLSLGRNGQGEGQQQTEKN